MYSNAVAVMLPVHASWLNQVELCFSIVQRKVLTPLDVANETALTNRLLALRLLPGNRQAVHLEVYRRRPEKALRGRPSV